MQNILIDLDGTADFLFAVRIRGVICEAAHPARVDMETLERRVKRADHPDEGELRRAVGLLAQRMVGAIFASCPAWQSLKEGALRDEPLSRQEAIVLVYQYLAVATKFTGGDVGPFAAGSFSLIAEDDGVTKARAAAAANLPAGRVVGAAAEAPQKGEQASS